MLQKLLLSLCVALALSDTNNEDAATRALFNAVEADDGAAVLAAIDAGARINEHRAAYNSGQQTPLMLASLAGKANAARELLQLGADATIGERDGYTPLHGVAFQGRPEVARILLADPQVPNIEHHDGYSPIHRACWGGEKRHAETVAAFIAAGVDPVLPSKSGETPMMLAKKTGNLDTMKVLRAALKAKEKEL